jgi:hypothetical protein
VAESPLLTLPAPQQPSNLPIAPAGERIRGEQMNGLPALAFGHHVLDGDPPGPTSFPAGGPPVRGIPCPTTRRRSKRTAPAASQETIKADDEPSRVQPSTPTPPETAECKAAKRSGSSPATRSLSPEDHETTIQPRLVWPCRSERIIVVDEIDAPQMGRSSRGRFCSLTTSSISNA